MVPTLRPGPGRCWGQCPRGWGSHEGKLVSFSEAAAGEATLSLLPAGADLTRGSRCLELRALIPHLAIGPPQPSATARQPLTWAWGRRTGLGMQHTSESSRLVLSIPSPPTPKPSWRECKISCVVALVSSAGPHCRSGPLPCHRLSLWGFLPSQGTLGKVWRHFSCLTGGLLLASGV